MSDREQLRAERRKLEAEYRRAYEALDEHFMLYGDVDGPEPVGIFNAAETKLPVSLDDDDPGYVMPGPPDEFPDDDGECDYGEEDVVG